ncbi:hypothetical protein CORC01_00635 [Colletotrichum orchidophilum]|uniref:Monooxygenase n=1 Tax=Colletotrichum orchidophilum TaxID=1209926 RepID=A0A1G4BSK0_9PEZI|nr:uncharacterized protein CORC01_00635 [Colletotrichum orchidophilum]OHF04296.1 hypothetical protein CORC01_00635 [Colletotrichum orchidophilum]
MENTATEDKAADRFNGIFKPTESPLWNKSYNVLPLLIKDGFNLTTLFTIGALMQSILFLILPAKYALIPASALGLSSIVSTIMETRSEKSNPYMKGVVRGRTSAQFPNPATGAIPAVAASQSLVVFHLGVRFNHPMGLLCPGGREIGDFFQEMNKDLAQRASEYGLYHVSNWLGTDGPRNNSLLNIYYFRDVEGLNKFAHDPIHRKGWDWYNSFKQQHSHIGIYHENFVTNAGQYETIYGNMKPLLLGAASVECQNEESGAKVWVNTLVDANVGPLRGMMRRMGKKETPLAHYA